MSQDSTGNVKTSYGIPSIPGPDSFSAGEGEVYPCIT